MQVEDIWESEESVSGDSDEEEDSSSDEDQEEENITSKVRAVKVDEEPKLSDLLIPGVSTRSGRSRKRALEAVEKERESPNAKKGRGQMMIPVTSATPNILVRTRQHQVVNPPTLAFRSPLVLKTPDGKTQVNTMHLFIQSCFR